MAGGGVRRTAGRRGITSSGDYEKRNPRVGNIITDFWYLSSSI
jgi:hypothetical protein